ncbi:MAG TPA: hypothetical protein VNV37_09120 [Solirubrobacteraceae bacterium]|jgi:hypothetical protein|nr:hypothetical protein [Solirubrobacteraceae bacterium]
MTTAGYVGQYAGVALMGGGTGLGELVSRYKDRPQSAATSAWGALYIAINAAASIAALGLALTYGWTFGASGDALIPTRMLIAGFGAMAFFRTSLFTVHLGNADVGVGPSSFLTLVLAACDRGVDRDRAQDRATLVDAVMDNVDYNKAKDSMPTVALALMQNMDPSDQAALATDLEKVDKAQGMSDRAKSLALGLALATAVGPEVLKATKEALSDEILYSTGGTPSSPPLPAGP